MAKDESFPTGVHHYSPDDEIPYEISKYWHQRHKIFSRYDEGVWMTDDAWFGVTPEPVALKIAEHVAAAPQSKSIIIDCFAGAGGNVIAFALSGRWKQVFAIEKNPEVLACAKHNAEIYGVADKIWWINGDMFDVLPKRLKPMAQDSVIFASPPWGGPTYTEWEVFDLALMQPYSLSDLYDAFSEFGCSDVALYLPRTSDLRQLARPVDNDGNAKVIHYCIHGASKALCIYYGDFDTA